MDTHTSIAYSCLDKVRGTEAGLTGSASVILSTASPYKFSRAVLEALGEDASGSDQENMLRCREITGAPIPAGLAGIWEREIRCTDVIDIDEMKSYVIRG